MYLAKSISVPTVVEHLVQSGGAEKIEQRCRLGAFVLTIPVQRILPTEQLKSSVANEAYLDHTDSPEQCPSQITRTLSQGLPL